MSDESSLIIKIFDQFIYQFDNGNESKFTDLMKKLIVFDPDIRSQAKFESNQSILKTWSSKINGRHAIKSMIKLLNKFETTLLQVISEGHQDIKQRGYDYAIQALTKVAIYDLEDAMKLIMIYINDRGVGPSEFWIYLNNTWQDARYYNRSWALSLASNTATNKLYQLRGLPLAQWTAQNIPEFDPADYAKYNRELKENNRFNARLRNITNVFIKGNPSRFNGNPQNRRFRNNGFNYNNNKDRYKNKSANSQKASKLFEWLIPEYQKLAGKVDWPREWCGFYHSEQGCLNEKCKRTHGCPICEEEHKITDCKAKKKKE